MPTLTDPVGDVSHATAQAAELFAAYHAAKSAHDVDRTMSFFATDKLTYSDAILGWQLPSFDALRGLFAQYMPGWGAGVSYATRVIGDDRSAVLFVTDSPELFGSEIRTISAVDLDGGKITRFVDYWDARAFGAEGAAQLRVPAEAFPSTFGEEAVAVQAAPGLRRVVDDLAAALAGGAAADAALLFADDATLEDLTLRTSVRGRRAISQYLERAVQLLPYGRDSAIRHVVGADAGGGYEWTNPTHDVVRGMSALTLDEGAISTLTAVWDGTLMDDSSFERLVLTARAT